MKLKTHVHLRQAPNSPQGVDTQYVLNSNIDFKNSETTEFLTSLNIKML